MIDTMYCLSCESWTKVHIHRMSGHHMSLVNALICKGPFTYSEPPEIDRDEYYFLIEPNYPEIMAIDSDAESF